MNIIELLILKKINKINNKHNNKQTSNRMTKNNKKK